MSIFLFISAKYNGVITAKLFHRLKKTPAYLFKEAINVSKMLKFLKIMITNYLAEANECLMVV